MNAPAHIFHDEVTDYKIQDKGEFISQKLPICSLTFLVSLNAYNCVEKKLKTIINLQVYLPISKIRRPHMFHAKGLKDLLKVVPLTEDFFVGLDPFHLNFIDMCFKKSLDEQIGMMSETEFGNYQIFLKYKSEYEEDFYPELKSLKKAS